MPTIKASLAEFVGTFALMFVGGGAMIVTGGENLLAIAFAHGLILAVMVSATMHVSGGQINPAVSIALGLVGKQPWSRAGVFIIAQVLGAVAAALLLRVLLSGAFEVGNVGATLGEFSRTGSEHGSAVKTVALEAIATFFLMFVIMGTAVDKRGVGKTAAIGGLAIGLTVAAAILCIGPATGASLNPARSFGPALVAEGGAWDMHWAYWVGPIIGAAMAALAYRVVLEEPAAERSD